MSDTADLQHGCRAEYGPLELRIQATSSSNGFIVYLEDPRLEQTRVFEHSVQSTLDAAKERAVSQADAYLNSRNEASAHNAKWRCS